MEFAWNNIILSSRSHRDDGSLEHRQGFVLNNLRQEASYEAQIQARNKFGWSQVSEKFEFYTRIAGEQSIICLFKFNLL